MVSFHGLEMGGYGRNIESTKMKTEIPKTNLENISSKNVRVKNNNSNIEAPALKKLLAKKDELLQLKSKLDKSEDALAAQQCLELQNTINDIDKQIKLLAQI